ncbi:transglycosylase domain-containing protein, partial [Streptomyces sp. ADI96-02]|uniref:transglycosylase domain-containing protein n=1 Tax=Streptomyces sp. ADI96-02 TaxID=1522760 RepID=UPI0019D13B60
MGRADARRAPAREARGAAKSGGIRGLFTWKKLLGAFFGLCLLVMGAFGALYVYVDVPAANAMAERQSNVYQYSDGTLMARSSNGVNRQIVDLAQVPKQVQHTFVAAENKTFYKDQGVDLKGITRGL